MARTPAQAFTSSHIAALIGVRDDAIDLNDLILPTCNLSPADIIQISGVVCRARSMARASDGFRIGRHTLGHFICCPALAAFLYSAARLFAANPRRSPLDHSPDMLGGGSFEPGIA